MSKQNASSAKETPQTAPEIPAEGEDKASTPKLSEDVIAAYHDIASTFQELTKRVIKTEERCAALEAKAHVH